MQLKFGVIAALAAAPIAFAQTFTDCNPLNTTCPNDKGLNAATYTADFARQGSSAAQSWTPAAGTNIKYDADGAQFTINSAGQSPTLSSDFYMFFGTLEVIMKAAPGQGIVSSIVLEGDDLDEIDWELLGGDNGQVQTNFFGKGQLEPYNRGAFHPVASPQTQFHAYKIDWSPERLIFSIDGQSVRTIAYNDPLANNGQTYPQTPMKVKLGNWAGGASGNSPGTIQWAGGPTDFSKAPFTMTVKSVQITNTYPANEYRFKDRSGSWQSIERIGGTSDQVPNGVSRFANDPADDAASGTADPATSSAKSTIKATKSNEASPKATADSISNIAVARYTTTTNPAGAASTTLATSSRSASGSASGVVSGVATGTTTPTSSSNKNATGASTAVPLRATGAAAGGPAIAGVVAAFSIAACLWTL